MEFSCAAVTQRPFASEDLGVTKDGYRLRFQPKLKRIDQTDAYGQTLVELINCGGDWSLSADSMEWKAGPMSALTQFMGTLGFLNNIGATASESAEALVMTVTAGSSAGLNGAAVNTLTAFNAVLAPDSDISLLFDCTLREFPIRLQFLPFADSGTVRHFNTT